MHLPMSSLQLSRGVYRVLKHFSRFMKNETISVSYDLEAVKDLIALSLLWFQRTYC